MPAPIMPYDDNGGGLYNEEFCDAMNGVFSSATFPVTSSGDSLDTVSCWLRVPCRLCDCRVVRLTPCVGLRRLLGRGCDLAAEGVVAISALGSAPCDVDRGTLGGILVHCPTQNKEENYIPVYSTKMLPVGKVTVRDMSSASSGTVSQTAQGTAS
jgi:hypothetical protein